MKIKAQVTPRARPNPPMRLAHCNHINAIISDISCRYSHFAMDVGRQLGIAMMGAYLSSQEENDGGNRIDRERDNTWFSSLISFFQGIRAFVFKFFVLRWIRKSQRLRLHEHSALFGISPASSYLNRRI